MHHSLWQDTVEYTIGFMGEVRGLEEELDSPGASLTRDL